jgi:putative ABC transport system ATP-binding protein
VSREPLLALQDVTKVYHVGQVDVHALCGVSMEVAAGEWLAVMGASGSGKSTLLHIMGCLDVPSSGSYRLAGLEVAGMSDDRLAVERNRRIGFVFQSFNLLPRTAAIDQVQLPLQYQRDGGRLPAARRRELAEEVLASVGLSDRAKHLPTELSGGQQQKVAIARALITQPSILMADEPTGNLDSRSGAEILEVLEQLHRDRDITVIMVTHEDSVAAHAKRVIRLLDGEIVEDSRR